MKIGFDNELYLKVQSEAILERASHFNKLYLEVGGKLFDDMHASRVLPGFKPDNKMNVLSSLKDKSEVIIVINSKDIEARKMRLDLGITYDVEVERLINEFTKRDISVNSVVFSFYESNPTVDQFMRKLKRMKIQTYKHYKIAGYPQDISLIVSKDGLGKNEYIKTTKDIVIVTAPGPGSGKMATCLSQMYHDFKNGIKTGYAKYETFPVWNLPLLHPVNIAYEAATLDLNDVNMIDPYHLEHYGISCVNYNRDVATYPLLKNIFYTISGEIPYFSPTDMGVNRIADAIIDDHIVSSASKREVIRRYYYAQKDFLLGKIEECGVRKGEMLINKLSLTLENRVCVKAANEKSDKEKVPAIALELSDGSIITGKSSNLLTSSAAIILNSLKRLAHIPDEIMLLSPSVIEPIQKLKVETLHNDNPRIHADEILIALAIQANTNPLASAAINQLEKLKGCEAHSSCILDYSDFSTFQKIGVHMTEEAKSYFVNN